MDAHKKEKLALFIKKTRGNISQRQFAKKVGVSFYAVNQWEAGASSPSSENMQKLAQACGLTVDEIYKEVGEEIPEKMPEEYKQAEDVFFLARQLSLVEQAKLIELLSASVTEQLIAQSQHR